MDVSRSDLDSVAESNPSPPTRYLPSNLLPSPKICVRVCYDVEQYDPQKDCGTYTIQGGEVNAK